MMVKLEQLVTLCLVLAGLSHCEQVRYDGYRAYDVIPTNQEELDTLTKLEADSDAVIFPYGIDGIGQRTNVVVPPHKLVDFEQILASNGLKYKETSYNLQRSLLSYIHHWPPTATYTSTAKPYTLTTTTNYDWNNYYPWQNYVNWLMAMEIDYGEALTLLTIGGTDGNRRVIMARIIISDDNGQYDLSRPNAYIEAGIHGNEWISSATATFIIKELLTSQDEDIRILARSYNWYILPHANPDGYEHSYNKDRLWRKNRHYYNANCLGVDINRNFGAHFYNNHDTSDHCSYSFSGPRPESEVETQAITGFFSNLTVDLYISLQEYSQKLLYPYGYTDDAPENLDYLHRVAAAAVKALKKRYGTEYEFGNMYNTLNPINGSSMDWFYSHKKTKMAFTYKLRPSADSAHGISRLVPATQILPTARETLDSLVGLVKEIYVLMEKKYQ